MLIKSNLITVRQMCQESVITSSESQKEKKKKNKPKYKIIFLLNQQGS